ncbi:MAG: hypothetical protein GY803_12315 [Chloroflexi bacterium]|nr:hypothetical protein [Chloroflexota bacterium]
MEKQTLPSGVIHRHEPDVDIVTWSAKRDSLAWGNLLGLGVGGIFIVGVLLLFTRLLFSDQTSDKSFGDWVVILIVYGIVWFMVVGVLYAFQSMIWIEEVRIFDTDIVVHVLIVMRPKRSCAFTKTPSLD